MNTYLLLLRGVNVGGKNKLPMTVLREYLLELGFHNVTTYIASGNVVVQSDMSASAVRTMVEAALPRRFALDNDHVKVLVLAREQLERIINDKPPGFGDEPDRYYSDAIFVMDADLAMADVRAIFKPREGIDVVWQGEGIIYSQRLSVQRTKSQLSAIVSSPLYKSLTIRSWNTTVKLLDVMAAVEERIEK